MKSAKLLGQECQECQECQPPQHQHESLMLDRGDIRSVKRSFSKPARIHNVRIRSLWGCVRKNFLQSGDFRRNVV